MATAERLTVSVPSDLMNRARAAGLSPSEVFQAALRERLGDDGVKPLSEQVADLTAALAALSGRVAKVETATRKLARSKS